LISESLDQFTSAGFVKAEYLKINKIGAYGVISQSDTV